jgi:hypothetical protein
MEILNFVYNDQPIEFKPNGDDNVMVNATQMAKVFGKDVFQFTRIDDTKRFIDECLKPQNCGLLNIKNEEDLIVSKQKSGTFMHRILALKFAAWLDPNFEIWIFITIDQILNHYYRELRNATIEKMRIENLKSAKRDELLKKYPEFADYVELEEAYKSADARKAAISRSMSKQMKIEFTGNI